MPIMEGERDKLSAAERRARRTATAPSETWLELPAVAVPVSLNTGLSFAIAFMETSWRMPSSLRTRTVSSAFAGCSSVASLAGLVTVTGTIPWSKSPSRCAREALRWDSALKASWSLRLMRYLLATFSLVRPMLIMQSLASLTGLFLSSGHSFVGTALDP